MDKINPNLYQSVCDYLLALDFQIEGECFVKGTKSIPATEIAKHTPTTFCEYATARGWLTDESPSDDDHEGMTEWGWQFMLV